MVKFEYRLCPTTNDIFGKLLKEFITAILPSGKKNNKENTKGSNVCKIFRTASGCQYDDSWLAVCTPSEDSSQSTPQIYQR